jgi:hypothetical protein
MKFVKKKDIIIIALILLLAISLYYIYNIHNKDLEKLGAKAEIYYESELVMTVMLNGKIDKTFSLTQNEHVIFHLYEDGAIRFEQSNCPDKVCIKAGKLRHIGSSSACLPNKIILKMVPIKGTESNDVDLIVMK